MTNKNAKHQLEIIKQHLTYADDRNALDTAMGALDKVERYEKAIRGIRAEIRDLIIDQDENWESFDYSDDVCNFAYNLVLGIIKRHMRGIKGNKRTDGGR